jgi:hypothetical protein
MLFSFHQRRRALAQMEELKMNTNVQAIPATKSLTRRAGSFVMTLAFVVAAAFSTGCATKTQNGAVVGHQSGHAGEGAVIGGLAGAVAGGLIGNHMDNNSN